MGKVLVLTTDALRRQGTKANAPKVRGQFIRAYDLRDWRAVAESGRSFVFIVERETAAEARALIGSVWRTDEGSLLERPWPGVDLWIEPTDEVKRRMGTAAVREAGWNAQLHKHGRVPVAWSRVDGKGRD